MPNRSYVQPQAILLDLDGTLYVGDVPIPGAVEAVNTLRERNIPLRALTNTTRRSCRDLSRKLQNLGFTFAAEEIFTAPLAAARWLTATGHRRGLPRPRG